MAPKRDRTLGDWASNAAFVALVRCLRLCPYSTRIRLSGWVFANCIAPVAGANRRIRKNLLLIDEEISPTEIARISRAVSNNFGRSIAELYSGREFIDRVSETPIEGPGLKYLEKAHREGRPVILAASHFGNYDAWRSALLHRGFRVGAIYRPMNNTYFNRHYLNAMKTIGEPLFARDTELRKMLRFLRAGGMVAFGFDQAFRRGETLTFFGLPAKTPISAAELALKLKADLIPIYAIRQPDGLSFRVVTEEPVSHTDPLEMTQTLNDRLEAIVRQNMGQWLWLHRRWK